VPRCFSAGIALVTEVHGRLELDGIIEAKLAVPVAGLVDDGASKDTTDRSRPVAKSCSLRRSGHHSGEGNRGVWARGSGDRRLVEVNAGDDKGELREQRFFRVPQSRCGGDRESL
jgi:hypothetical protein